jgi:DNA repair protein RecN (Recombination protein N)
MLEQLSVRGYALIDSVEVEFAGGFNILTGETGAGKSILIGALGLLFGEKGETDSIREGMEEAEVSCRISIAGNADAEAWCEAKEIEPEDGTLLLRRTVKRGGRGSIFIQSTPMTKQDLQELTSLLVDVHGQHEHQTLFKLENHRILLDRYAGTEADALRLHDEFLTLTSAKKELDNLLQSERDRIRETEILQFAVTEIEKAGLKPGEEEGLEQEIRILSDHEKLFRLIDEIYENTAESRGGALVHLRTAKTALGEVSRIDETMEELHKRLENAFYEIEDISESAGDYRDRVDYSPEKLEQLENRLALIRGLEKKYGDTIDDVLQYLENSRGELLKMENWEEEKEQLSGRIKQLERGIFERASKLSAKRKEAAKELEEKIEISLRHLGMPDAEFSVRLDRKISEGGKPACGPYGFDRIEFLISPNKGETEKPIRQIASGGEISRIMLAIKTVLSETDTVNTLIFDEIDAGIGGEVALQVGEHLHQVSRHKQVLCITHLASIAVRADNHIKVEKVLADDRRVTTIHCLRGEQRIKEIARMLSGDTNRDASLSHAKDMLAEYHQL